MVKLTENGKNKLRVAIIEELRNINETQMIKIDPELLEELIFFKFHDEKGNVVKVPIWTGEFLRKIDLKDVSFENVLLDADCNIEDFTNNIPELKKRLEKIDENIKFPFINNGSGYKIDLSSTNAVIDFSKIYARNGIKVSNCNLSDMKNILKTILIKKVSNSDFSHNEVNAPELAVNTNYEGCNFDNSFISINFSPIPTYRNDGINTFCNCNFKNAGINIQLDPKSYQNNLEEFKMLKERLLFLLKKSTKELLTENEQRELYSLLENNTIRPFVAALEIGMLIKNNNISGCFINGIKILNQEEIANIRKSLIKSYEEKENEMLEELRSSIKLQQLKYSNCLQSKKY